jgi:N-acetylneuraminic acid mutarotase
MKRKLSCFLILLTLNALLAMAPISTAKEGAWTKKADMPTARWGFSTSVVNGKIYAIGGWPDGGNMQQALSIVEEYNVKKDSWMRKANMPTARSDFSTSVVSGKIYAIGGRTSGAVLSVLEEYDPKTDKWTRKSDLPTARVVLSTCAVNGKIYAIGGAKVFSAISTFSPVEEYNPMTDEWVKKASMPTARIGFSTSVVNDKIYAIGGATGPFVPGLSVVEEYDPVTDKWTQKASMSTARGYLSTSAVRGKIYAIGGATGCGFSCAGVTLSTVEEYDIESVLNK